MSGPSAPLQVWDRNVGVLASGTFLVAREVPRLLKRQGSGGSIVLVGSKNALAASGGASAYSGRSTASKRAARSTGNILNVDAGNAAAFPR